jgi:hypothetical protein
VAHHLERYVVIRAKVWKTWLPQYVTVYCDCGVYSDSMYLLHEWAIIGSEICLMIHIASALQATLDQLVNYKVGIYCRYLNYRGVVFIF